MTNYVSSGDYRGSRVTSTMSSIVLKKGFFGKVEVNHNTVESYEVINDANSKLSKNNYMVSVTFKDGKKSLLELNNILYKHLVRVCF